MKDLCLSKVRNNKNLGKYVNIPKDKEKLYQEGDYVKIIKLDLEGDE